MTSPCINQCQLNEARVCIGCGRTLEQIKQRGLAVANKPLQHKGDSDYILKEGETSVWITVDNITYKALSDFHKTEEYKALLDFHKTEGDIALSDFNKTEGDIAQALFSVCFEHYTKNLHVDQDEADYVLSLEVSNKDGDVIELGLEQSKVIRRVMDGMFATAFILSVLDKDV